MKWSVEVDGKIITPMRLLIEHMPGMYMQTYNYVLLFVGTTYIYI